ncbi:MAG: hypothetical protein GC205_09225, partial [Bacteroidetes bacterium]|nr:hypothetical protein [Bacteroidota bacterium]
MFLGHQSQASSVLASAFGYDPLDATAALHAALLSPADTVFVDLQSEPWRVGPGQFVNLSNKTILFAPGVVVEALPGQFNGLYDCLLTFIRCNQIELLGYGTTLRMNRAEFAALGDSEYRHCLRIENCRKVTVKGFLLEESGGDGVYVGGADWFGGA